MNGRRKTILFREVNDTIDKLLEQFCADEEASFLCECPSALCARRVRLTRQAYEDIRAIGAFVVAPECAHWLRPVFETERYVVVEDFRPPLAPVAAA
jgi:hypothetical protein